MVKFKPIARGMGYYHLTKHNFDLDVVRIEFLKARPFIMGSTLGEVTRRADSSDLPTTGIRKPYKMTSDGKWQSDLLFLDREIIIESDDMYNKSLINLNPVWVSNGTFFGQLQSYNFFRRKMLTNYDLPTNLSGPVIATSSSNSSAARTYRFADADKKVRKIIRNRWFVRQDTPYDPPILKKGPVISNDLEDSVGNLFGGAGPLIDNGSVVSVSSWRKDYNFKPSAYYDPGTVIAQNSPGSPRRVFYLIMSRNDWEQGQNGWMSLAKYISSYFVSDLGLSANDRITEAIVYDAGGSKSLYIPGQVPPRGTRPVPHFIWVWGQRKRTLPPR